MGQTTFKHMTYEQRYTRAIEFNKKAIAAIWEYREAIWAKRNDILQADSNKAEAIIHARINATIHQIYKDKEYYLDQYRQHFKIPIKYSLRPIKNKPNGFISGS